MKNITGDRWNYYKQGEMVYEIPARRMLAAKYLVRRHERCNGWQDMTWFIRKYSK